MSQTKTILLIDDETSVLNSLALFLEDEGYRIFTAENGEEGLQTFSDEKIDLVLTDLRMPKKDGLEVMKTIYLQDPSTPMIVISGAGKKEDIIKALRMGAKDYITKPIDDLGMIGHTVRQVFENKRLNDENKAYRRQLEKSESKYRTITENIAEGVFTVDDHENFTYSNQAFGRMLGYTVEEILVRNLEELTTPKSFKIILDQTQNRMSGSTDRYVIEMLNSNKNRIHVELACSPIFGMQREYKGSTAVARDITQIVQLRKIYENFLREKDKPANDVTPICASCKNVRVRKGEWVPVEEHFNDTVFSHGICPTCCEKLYPEFNLAELENPSKK